MSKIKKRFVQWVALFSAFFAPVMAYALSPLLLVGAGLIGAGYGGYKLWKWLWGDEGSYPKILEKFTSINNGCWFCSLFDELFKSINSLTSRLSDVLTQDGLRLLGLGLGFYILFKVLKAVISFGEINPKEFFTDLFMPVLKCLVAVAVLANLGSFYGQIVNPLAELSIGFATEIQSKGSEAGLAPLVQVNQSGNKVESRLGCEESSYSTSNKAEFGSGVNNAIQCFLQMASFSLIQYMALGATFICDSFVMGYKVFPHWSMLLVGLCLFIGTFGIFLSFPFKLVDGMFRLMFVSALMPLWVVLWVLPQTREYSKKAFDMFLNVLVTFIVLSVILLMCLTILGAALGDLANNQDFWKLMMDGKTKKALEMIDWSSGTFFTMVAMTFLALSLVGKTESFVSAFVGGSTGGGMGSALEGMAMAGVGLVGSKIAKPIAKEAASATGKAIGGTADMVGKGAVEVGKGIGKGIATGVKKMPYAAGYAVGTIKRGLHNLNSGPKMSAGQAMTPTGMVPPAGTVSPSNKSGKPSVLTSTSREQLPDGKMKDTSVKTFKNADGKLTHKEVSDIIMNAKGEVESKIQKRESFDAATGNKKGSATIETRYNKDGSSTQLKTEYDALDKKKSTLETTNSGTVKTEFDDLGREKRVTMKDRDGNTSVETNTFDAAGNRTSFLTEVKDAAGKTTEHFKVDLSTNKKTDLLTGTTSDYVV